MLYDSKLLRDGLTLLGFDPFRYQQFFIDYLDLLEKWNRVYNLTAINDANDRIIKHLFDSLVVAPYLSGQRIIDVGTGAGFPGIPLAIVDSSRQFVLLDSQIKKIKFLTAVKNALGLTHVEIVHARVEDFSPDVLFDTVMTRAFAPLDVMREKTQHLLHKEGKFLAMKGQYPSDELKAMGVNDSQVYKLEVPYLDEARHVVIISRSVGPAVIPRSVVCDEESPSINTGSDGDSSLRSE